MCLRFLTVFLLISTPLVVVSHADSSSLVDSSLARAADQADSPLNRDSARSTGQPSGELRIVDKKDTILVLTTSTLNDIVRNTYSYLDSAVSSPAAAVSRSRDYPQVLLALRDFVKWTFVLSITTTSCRIESEILPSRALRLGRSVDMSNIRGQRKVHRVVVMATIVSSNPLVVRATKTPKQRGYNRDSVCQRWTHSAVSGGCRDS